MLRNRDELLLAIMSRLDTLDADTLAAEFVRLSPDTSAEYPFLFRTERTTARTFAAFVESAFLRPSMAATRH